MIYENEKTQKISFPLGGIGTGCIGLTGYGALNDWEIFNRPNKNTCNGYSHFAIKAKCRDKIIAKVLQADTKENLMGTHERFGHGLRKEALAGVPHFKNLRFEGNFPIANLTYTDEDFPATVRLCAFNPFIPHDEFNSSLPAAFFEWEIENTAKEDIEYAIALSVQNPSKQSVNKAVAGENHRGVFLGCADKCADEIGYCDLSILTDSEDSVAEEYWYRGARQDHIVTFWNNFKECDRLPVRGYKETSKQNDHGSLASYIRIKAGEKAKIRFVLAWNTPVQYNFWEPFRDDEGKDITWKNYYATRFDDSYATAKYALTNFTALQEKTERFVRALTESTLPPFVVDAISANLSVLKSPTVLRLENGELWGWEGVSEDHGVCEGSCQHVWNYAYAVPFLFPNLERTLRESTMKYAMLENGKTTFRVPLPLGRKYDWFGTRTDGIYYCACVDGQMGEVIKCYREWKISGNTDWLKTYSKSIFKMLDFAWSAENDHQWDANQDGVLDGRQHNTLDIELFGANSWLQGFYLLALDCGAKMAEALGDKERKQEYEKLYQKGKNWMNEHLFNGEYFMQKVDINDKSVLDKFGVTQYSWNTQYYWNEETGEIKYQIGEGCIIDQMLADWHASIIGTDGVFDESKKKKALQSLYKYNYKTSMREIENFWRGFSLNDEAGTMICAYPNGVSVPSIPVLYGTETMAGFEYALGGLMLSQGFIAEGEAIVKAVRDRYDGEKRNPWNEMECGSNYARSMASYALLPIYSGFTFDIPKKRIGFAPLQKGDGQYLWSVGNSWGRVRFAGKKRTIVIEGEEFSLSVFDLQTGESAVKVRVDGKEIPFAQDGTSVIFSETAIKRTLEIEVK